MASLSNLACETPQLKRFSNLKPLKKATKQHSNGNKYKWPIYAGYFKSLWSEFISHCWCKIATRNESEYDTSSSKMKEFLTVLFLCIWILQLKHSRTRNSTLHKWGFESCFLRPIRMGVLFYNLIYSYFLPCTCTCHPLVTENIHLYMSSLQDLLKITYVCLTWSKTNADLKAMLLYRGDYGRPKHCLGGCCKINGHSEGFKDWAVRLELQMDSAI